MKERLALDRYGVYKKHRQQYDRQQKSENRGADGEGLRRNWYCGLARENVMNGPEYMAGVSIPSHDGIFVDGHGT